MTKNSTTSFRYCLDKKIPIKYPAISTYLVPISYYVCLFEFYFSYLYGYKQYIYKTEDIVVHPI